MFDDTFNDNIFVGDHQFVVQRYFQPREQLDAITEREKIVFYKKKRYKYFCISCKIIYINFFEKKLHVFSRTD